MADDRDALKALAEVSPIDKEHAITHYLYMPTEENAHQVDAAIRALGYETESPYELMGSWGVRVFTRFIPNENSIADYRARFTQIAEQYDGEYDGWEAKVE